jgi:hypothetical protein
VAPVLLYGLFGLFVAATGYLIASSLTRRSVPTYVPTGPTVVRAQRDSFGVDTLTIEATDADRWTYVSLSRGAVLTPLDSTGWELAVQRYQVRTSGTVAEVSSATLDSVRANPPSLNAAVTSARSSRDLGHWYRYSWLTHLLEPRERIYVMRTSRGQAFALQIISYYCPGPTAGCVTLRYAPVTSAPSARE